MDENAVFQGQNLEQPQSYYQPVQAPQMQTPPPPPPEEGSRFNFSPQALVKLLIGLVVVILLLTVLIVVVLPRFTQKNNQKVTLVYWGLWESPSVMQPVISDFERQYPNITVEYSQQDIKQYRERLMTRISNGNGPDVFRFHDSWYPMLSSYLAPLSSDTISNADFSRLFYPVAVKDLVKNGAIYGIPLEIDTLGLYINTDILKAAGLTPPATWNDFVNDAKTMTVKDSSGKIKTAGAALGTYSNVTHAPDIMALLFAQNGVNMSTMTPAQSASDALNFYTSFALDNANVWDNTLDPSILAFSKGNLAMYFGYSWDYFTIKAANPSLNFEIVPVPQLPGQNINIASYWVEGVSSKSKHQKEAMLFLKYLSQASTEQKLYGEESKTRDFGELYARTDLASTLEQNPTVSPFIKEAPTAVSSFFADGTYDDGLNSQVNTYLGNAINSMFNNTSADTAIGTLSQGVAQVLKQYGQ